MLISRCDLVCASLLALCIHLPAEGATHDGRVRALRLRHGATATTQYVTNLPVNGDATFRVLIKRNEWDLGARHVFTLANSQGDVRFGIGYNTSPWVDAMVSTLGFRPTSTNFGAWDYVPFGCPSGERYEDWWVVYKAPGPAGGESGYLRVYHNGRLADKTLAGYPYDIPIPAGTDMTWRGGPLALRIGDSVYGQRQDYQLLDLCWWTGALSDSQIETIGRRQISELDDATRRNADIYWYARPNPDAEGRIEPELGTAVGNAALAAQLLGDTVFVADVPGEAGWEIPDDLAAPDPGPSPLMVSSTETAVQVTAGEGDGTAVLRELVLSKGEFWRYSVVSRVALPVGETSHTFEGLTPGATYFVTALWSDQWGNGSERQSMVRLSGQEPRPTGESRSLRFHGDGAARTFTDTSGTMPQLVELPFNVEGATVRIVVRRNSGMGGPNLFFSSRADKVSDYGYSRFSLGLEQHGNIVAKVSDGQTVVVAEAQEQLQVGVFEELFLVYEAPHLASTGSVRVYRRSGRTVVQIAESPIPAMDFTWKKWDAEFVLGGLDNAWPNASIDYNLLEAAFWTKALSVPEMSSLVGRGLHSVEDYDQRIGSHLYWYARPRAETALIPPDLGTSIGTAVIRRRDVFLGEPGTITPLIPTFDAGDIQFSTDVPPEYVTGIPPYSLADVADALGASAGLIELSVEECARLDVSGTEAPGVVNIEDAVIIARMAAGLEQNP